MELKAPENVKKKNLFSINLHPRVRSERKKKEKKNLRHSVDFCTQKNIYEKIFFCVKSKERKRKKGEKRGKKKKKLKSEKV